MIPRQILPVLLIAAAAPLAQAQLFTVFPNYPTRLQDVVNAAPPNAVLVVFPGEYTGLKVEKPLRIIATYHPFKRVRVHPLLDQTGQQVLGGPLEVAQIGAAEALVISGIDFFDGHLAAANQERAVADIADCAGRLHFADCRFLQAAQTQNGMAAALLTDCAAATFEDCVFQAAQGGAIAAQTGIASAHEALRIEATTVTLQECLLEAQHVPAGINEALGTALAAKQADIQLARCTLLAGVGAAALRLDGGTTRITGTTGGLLRGGAAALIAGDLLPGGAALAAEQAAQIRLHADVQVAAGQTIDMEEPTAALSLADDVVLDLVQYRAPWANFMDSTVVAGGAVHLEVSGEVGAFVLPAVAFEAQLPLGLGGVLGELWMDPATLATFPVAPVLTEVPIELAGQLAANMPIGRLVTAQTLQFGIGLPFELSTPTNLMVLP
jgi:hypothetical protein